LHLLLEHVETKTHSSDNVFAGHLPQNFGPLIEDINEHSQPVVIDCLAKVRLLLTVVNRQRPWSGVRSTRPAANKRTAFVTG